MEKILFLSGLIVYALNYAIGWAIYFKKIVIGKNMHRLLLSLIILNLFALLFFLPLYSLPFFFCTISLISMLILPLGRKGGIYHGTVSTAGIIMFLIAFTVWNINYIDYAAAKKITVNQIIINSNPLSFTILHYLYRYSLLN